jgi:hypothetical protein
MRSRRGSRERVDAARRQAALALGREPGQRDAYVDPTVSTSAQAEPSRPPAKSTDGDGPRTVGSQAIGVLTITEAAARLQLSRAELEAMIAAGKVATLPTGFSVTIPTFEIERLRKR